jgi:hypothetical protein
MLLYLVFSIDGSFLDENFLIAQGFGTITAWRETRVESYREAKS